MFRNYLLSTLRQIKKHYLFFLINVLGFSIGIATVVIIFLYIHNELSFDKGMKHYDNLYRVCWETTLSGVEKKSPASPAPLCAAFIDEFPEVINGVRLFMNDNAIVVLDEKSFRETNFYYADSTFFELFSIQLIIGEEGDVLTKPNTIVLPESTAKKLFGEKNALGESVLLEGVGAFEVVGICEDIPGNYHLDIDYIASINSLEVSKSTHWENNPFHTYLLLSDEASVDDLENKIPDLVKLNMESFIQRIMNISFDEFIENGSNYNYTLQAVRDIHFGSGMEYDFAKRTNIRYVYIFMLVAILILCLAIVNYVNLSTAKGFERCKEIAIRKIVGASRIEIIKQFIGESLFLTFISTIIGMMLVESSLPYINSILDKSLSVNYFNNIIVFPTLILFVIILSFLSGLYPAFIISSFRVLSIFRKKSSSGKTSLVFRSVLVIFQYVISFLLIIGTIVVFEQLNYMRDKELGFDQERLLVLQNADVLEGSIFSFKEELQQESYIDKVSMSARVPGQNISIFFMFREGDPKDNVVSTLFIPVDHDFIDCYNLKIVDGRKFNIDSDSIELIVNEAAVKEFGLENPLEEAYYSSGAERFGAFPIVGVVENFNIESLQEEVKPCFITATSMMGYRYITVKIKSGDLSGAVQKIKEKWETFVDNRPFEYFFIDQHFDAMYKQEELMRKIFTVFSFISIFIASIGLFGIVLFMTEKRTKEIGIRKAIGASRRTIFKLFINQYIKWIVISVIIGAPVAWWASTKWLQQFAYRINFHVGFLLIAFILLFIVTFITVYSRVMHVAKQNPVKALRYE